MKLKEIKLCLNSGDIAGAEAAAQELLAAEPDNVQAMMLYGTCRQLQGDDETFRRIHDELAPKMATVVDGEASRLWRKYDKEYSDADLPQLRMSEGGYAKAGAVLKEYVILGGIVVIAIGVAVYLLGKEIMAQMSVMSLYRGPSAEVVVEAVRKQPPIFDEIMMCPGGTTTVAVPFKVLNCEVVPSNDFIRVEQVDDSHIRVKAIGSKGERCDLVAYGEDGACHGIRIEKTGHSIPHVVDSLKRELDPLPNVHVEITGERVVITGTVDSEKKKVYLNRVLKDWDAERISNEVRFLPAKRKTEKGEM